MVSRSCSCTETAHAAKRGISRWRTSAAAFTSLPTIASIRSPLLILTAELDFALEPARRLRDLAPGAEYREIPGGPHNAYFEMPDTWNAIVDNFLSRVLAGTAPPLPA